MLRSSAPNPFYCFETCLIGDIRGIGLSGDGTLYISYEEGGGWLETSAVDKRNGDIIRNIYSGYNRLIQMRAYDNRVLILNKSYAFSFDWNVIVIENERLVSTIELLECEWVKIISNSYVIYKSTVLDGREIILKNINNLELTEKVIKTKQSLNNPSFFLDSFTIWCFNHTGISLCCRRDRKKYVNSLRV